VALNVVPDALSRTLIEKVITADEAEIQIDLKLAAFQSREYQELVLTVGKYAGRVPNTQTWLRL